LKGLDAVAPKRIGVVGWCMGGGLALSAAAHDGDTGAGDVGAAVVFYGRPLDPGDTAKIQAPVLGLYGAKDQGIPVEAVRAFEQELRANQTPHEIHVYPGAGHAFFNDTRPHIYQPEAAQDAWEKTLAWFRKHLV
jgi:carboxymethylenebutenolidase